MVKNMVNWILNTDVKKIQLLIILRELYEGRRKKNQTLNKSLIVKSRRPPNFG